MNMKHALTIISSLIIFVSCSPQEIPFHYTCDNGQTFDVVFNNTDINQTADITMNGRSERLTIAISASGSRYTSDKGHELWLKGNEAMFTPHSAGQTTNCRTSD